MRTLGCLVVGLLGLLVLDPASDARPRPSPREHERTPRTSPRPPAAGSTKAAPGTSAKGRHAKPIAKHQRRAPASVAPPSLSLDTRGKPTRPAPRADASKLALMQLYQRIGHDLRGLQALRGHTSTFELWPRFRAIRLDTALATPDSRLDMLYELEDLKQTIERARGIELSADGLHNPLVRSDLTPTHDEAGVNDEPQDAAPHD